MKTTFLTIINAFLLVNSGFGQNLVLNPSFEDTLNDCSSSNYFICKNWVNANVSTSDYWSSNADLMDCWGSPYLTPQTYLGFQNAQSGNAFIGLVLYEGHNSGTKEYAQGFLTSPLISNKMYHVAMYVNMADSSNFKTCEIELAFSDQVMISNSNGGSLNLINKVQFDISNVDSINWQLLKGSYVANGGEKFIYIGSNKQNATLTCIDSLNSGYYSTQAAYYFVDDIYVSEFPLTLDSKILEKTSIYPTIGEDKLTIKNIGENINYSIYDLTGKTIESKTLTNGVIDLMNFSKGMYFLKIEEQTYQFIKN